MEEKKGRYIGIVGAFLIHLGILALLFYITIIIPQQEEESGIPVMLGDTPEARGMSNPETLVDVKILPKEVEAPVKHVEEQELLTQEVEESVAIPPKKEKVVPKKVKPEKSPEELAAEAKKRAEEKAEQERKAAAEAARNRVAGAFGKGAQMGDKGDTEGKGNQGSPTGNSTSGALSGSAGYGTFDLGGRSIGGGGLPKPNYNVQEEGRVVVSITVNPAGNVIATSINKLTNTVNPALRKAAEEAAKKAKFNAVAGPNNQMGTITYYFNLK